MKPRYLFALAFLLVCSVSAAGDLTIGQRDSVHSDILGQQRDFLVYLPPSYYSAPERAFPVLYIVDGAYNFRYVSGLLELEGAISERIPQMILIALSGEGSKTYSHNSKPALEGVQDKGNAEAMARFIAEELMPWVDANYRSANFNILAGHSIGGLFVVNTALNHPELFDRYIAISPALWWQGHALNRVAKSKVDGDFATTMYLSVGQQRNMGVDSFLAAATGSVLKSPVFIIALLTVCILMAIVWGVKRKKLVLPIVLVVLACGVGAWLHLRYMPQDGNFMFERFPAENHNSVGEPTYRWALEDIFAGWRSEPPYFTSSEAFAEHYDQVKATYGSHFNVPSAVLRYSNYFMPKENPGALKAFEAMLKADYANAYARLKLIQARQLLEDQPDKAETLLNAIVQRDPGAFVALNLLARIKLQQGKPAQASARLSQAVSKAHQQHARQWQLDELRETQRLLRGFAADGQASAG